MLFPRDLRRCAPDGSSEQNQVANAKHHDVTHCVSNVRNPNASVLYVKPTESHPADEQPKASEKVRSERETEKVQCKEVMKDEQSC